MVPVYVKGGSWSNVEDEILKAAVSKYGLNQWARVASLLARKTAKQARARWNEYLDPRLKKSDWLPQEDAKLLEFARLMPNQWRTIASKIGRTATQCIERYQTLLDDGEGPSELSLTGPGVETLESVGASKDLQLGDINVNPETKEARPDAVDLDDDEKEMLSEARARLANTKGKKATRKARERMLEESKRVALLQRRRDLKQAGITTKLKAPKKKFDTQFDYNADIPFEHQPSGGFYDITEERQENDKMLQKFEHQVNRSGLKDDNDRKEKKRTKGEKSSGQVIEKPAAFNEDSTKRRTLELPTPVFQDDELLHLSKKSKEEMNNIAKLKGSETTASYENKIDDMVQKIKDSKGQKSALLTTEEAEDLEIQTVVEEEKEISRDPKQKPVSLREKLLNLPAPKNDFELADDEEDETMDKASQTQNTLAEDRGEQERLSKIAEDEQARKALLRRSQTVQRNLEIPNIDSSFELQPITESVIEILINKELVKLIRSDYSKTYKVGGIPLIGDLDEESRGKVKEALKSEIDEDELTRFQTSIAAELSTTYEQPPEDTSSLVSQLTALIEYSNKLEKKLIRKFAGYEQRNDTLNEEYLSLLKDLKDADRAHSAFEMLYHSESIMINKRADSLREEVNRLVQAEQRSQERYLELKRSLNR